VTITQLLVVLQRLVHVLDEPLEIQDAPDAVAFPASLQQGLVVRGLQFRYYAESDPVFNDVSLSVPKGTWLCVMGASGSGKSTLLYLLNRLYEPTAGEILIDGIPLNRIQLDSLRRRMALVPQEAQIFSGTIRDNICYAFPDAEPRQIVTAARAAEIHDTVMELPVRYETIVGQKGATLSGGQRQRISLARALLMNPEILLLDDCTSALDAETERRIQTTLASIMLGKTAIIVSQRVSMARRCHQICVLADGAVSELGTHDSLVKGGGFYARLVQQQTR
jgi:ATP-binding cassette, subfamily B, bacterial